MVFRMAWNRIGSGYLSKVPYHLLYDFSRSYMMICCKCFGNGTTWKWQSNKIKLQCTTEPCFTTNKLFQEKYILFSSLSFFSSLAFVNCEWVPFSLCICFRFSPKKLSWNKTRWRHQIKIQKQECNTSLYWMVSSESDGFFRSVTDRRFSTQFNLKSSLSKSVWYRIKSQSLSIVSLKNRPRIGALWMLRGH